MKKLLIAITFLFLVSCSERVKIVRLERLIIDTTYVYKIEAPYEVDKPVYSTYATKAKLDSGDYIRKY